MRVPAVTRARPAFFLFGSSYASTRWSVQRVLRPVEAPRVSCGVVAASCVAFYTLESVVLGIMFGYPYRMFCNGT